MSFVQLRMILASEHDTNAILKYLQQVAVLVQGNWVVNSELIYPKDTMSAHSGIPAELMCRARDYIVRNSQNLINIQQRKYNINFIHWFVALVLHRTRVRRQASGFLRGKTACRGDPRNLH